MGKGEEVFREVLKFSDYKKKNILKKHTKRVADFCEELAEIWNNESPNKVDVELLLDAAWLHDVGKIHNKNKHEKKKTIKKVIDDIYSKEEFNVLTMIISNHKGKFNPKKYKEESAILRLCDKVDKFHKGDKKDARRICHKTLMKIERKKHFNVEDMIRFYKFYLEYQNNFMK